MRIWCLVLAVVAMVATQRPATAQDKAAAMQAEVLKKMLSRFDLNGDGNIDDEEKTKAAEQLKKQFQEGKLPPQEAALLKAMMAHLQAGGAPQFGGGDRGGGFGGPSGGQIPPDILKKFDKNKNGQLDDDELKAAKAALGPKKSRKEQLLDKLDLNGDGKITQEEKDQVAAQRKAEQDEKKAEAEEKKAKTKKGSDKDDKAKDRDDKNKDKDEQSKDEK